MRGFEDIINKHALTDEQILNTAINFSIIKSNEEACLINLSSSKESKARRGDIGHEHLEQTLLEDPLKTQDYQMKVAEFDRDKRVIFLKGKNDFVYNSEFS